MIVWESNWYQLDWKWFQNDTSTRDADAPNFSKRPRPRQRPTLPRPLKNLPRPKTKNVSKYLVLACLKNFLHIWHRKTVFPSTYALKAVFGYKFWQIFNIKPVKVQFCIADFCLKFLEFYRVRNSVRPKNLQRPASTSTQIYSVRVNIPASTIFHLFLILSVRDKKSPKNQKLCNWSEFHVLHPATPFRLKCTLLPCSFWRETPCTPSFIVLFMTKLTLLYLKQIFFANS